MIRSSGQWCGLVTAYDGTGAAAVGGRLIIADEYVALIWKGAVKTASRSDDFFITGGREATA